MSYIGVKEWFRKKIGNQLDKEQSISQINTEIGKLEDERITKNLDYLKRTYFASPDNPVIIFSPEQTRERLKQASEYATHLGEDFSKSEPEEFRRLMKEYRYGILPLAEYEYYWIAIEKEAIKKIENNEAINKSEKNEIIKRLEQPLAIRKRIFQMCMANEIANPLLNEKAFDEVIGRIAYRHYQIDTAILRDEKNVVKFAGKYETTEKWETRLEGVRDVDPSVKTSQSSAPIVTSRLKSKIPKDNLKKIHKKDAEEIREKRKIQIIKNKAKIEIDVYKKKIQKAKKWYILSR